MMSPLIQTWYSQAALRADETAVIDAESGEELTFGELKIRVDALAADFASKGLQRRGVVLHRPNSPAWFVSYLSLRQAGAVVIPLDSTNSSERVSAVARAFGAAWIFDESGLCPVAGASRHWQAGLALIKLTSGTSGEPKGLPFTDTEMLADAANITATMGFGSHDRNLALHPLGHSYALGNVVYPLYSHGVSCVIGRAPFPATIAKDCIRHNVTVLPTVPAILDAMLRSEVSSLGRLRLVVSAAARLSPELAQAFERKLHLRIHNFYGSSETGGIAYDVTGEAGLRGDAVGTPLKHVRVSLDDSGAITVCSEAVARYRLRKAPGFPACRCLADRGQWVGDGQLALVGRTDRTVKRAGQRVDLDALERVLARECRVPVAVLWVSERLLVVVECPVCNLDGLRPVLSKIISSRFKLIRVDRLPKNARGKTDYARLAMAGN